MATINKCLNNRLSIRKNMSDGVTISKVDKRIIKVIKKSSRPLSKTEIARHVKLSPATVSKYVDVLAAKGILKLELYGNIHLVSMEGTDAN